MHQVGQEKKNPDYNIVIENEKLTNTNNSPQNTTPKTKDWTALIQQKKKQPWVISGQQFLLYTIVTPVDYMQWRTQTYS